MKKQFFKRAFALLTMIIVMLPTFTQFAVSAEESDKYTYNIFGRNGIEINAGNLCINGDAHTNKEAVITANSQNINGKITTGNGIKKRVKHVYADTKIREKYFTENCELHEDKYVKSEMNIQINSPIFSYRNIELDGNVALNSNIGTLMNINVTGEVKNANTSVVYSKYGNITIENDSTANINGLIYAPLGTLTINSPNVSINGVIIADKIIINGNSINLNGNDNIARFIGTESENYDFSDLEYLPEDWLGDTDEDILFDIYEKVIDTDPLNPDTDGDKLPDGYEVLTLNTDPLEVDTDENGISDADEDFDNDNLNNLGEYENKTEPFNPDTDDDGLLDGDEIKKYKTDPLNSDTDDDGLLDGEEGYDGTIYKKYGVYFDTLNPDTNGNGILDGDEVFGQTKKQEVSTYDEAITEVKVDMDTNGSLERNLKIESMYGIDAISSDVFAMIGEPFNFETSTSFESATITFKVDQSKLGDTEFDNLIILWYNKEDQIFEEMPTTRNKEKSTVSTTTTHFSQYMIVDSEKWYANWEASFTELRKMWAGGTTTYKSMNTVFIVDCSSDMSKGDSRLSICQNIMNNMMTNDKAAVITYASGINSVTGFMSPQSALANLESNISNFGVSSSLIRAFNKAMNLVYSSDAELNRIIIVTTSNSTFTFDLDEYNFSGVNVNVIDLGDYSMGLSLFNVTQLTGGGFYNAITADALTYQKGEEIYTPPQFIGEDSDGDTIPDIVEDYGLKPNGQPIGTNKLLKDTDGDGLDDNVELRFSVDNFKNDMDNDNLYYCRALYMATDPTKQDTDDDGFPDNYLESMSDKNYYRYTDPNPLKSDVTETSLKNDFFSIDYKYTGSEENRNNGHYNWKLRNDDSNASYGGYQGWLGRYGYTQDDRIFCLSSATGSDIHSHGCGIIATADMFLYLALSNDKYNPTYMPEYNTPINFGTDYNNISFDTYVSYITTFSNAFNIWDLIGGIPAIAPFGLSSLKKGMDILNSCNNMGLTIRWEHNTDKNECLNKIKKMINEDIPVVFSYNDNNKLQLYKFTNKKYVTNGGEEVYHHYMVATGIIEYSDEVAKLIGRKCMVRIATYGKEYYMDFDEYTPSLLDSNIMYVQK